MERPVYPLARETPVDQMAPGEEDVHRQKEDSSMQLGMIGLGRMGGNMARRLIQAGHSVVGYDRNPKNVQRALAAGVLTLSSAVELVQQLQAPRAIWLMIPHGKPTEDTVDLLLGKLAAGDIIVDGGNSRYIDSARVAKKCHEHGVHFIDAGVSGGVWGLEIGYCLMIGGPKPAFDRLVPIFTALAPADGFAYLGESGAGHFVKMVHNAIEYAMLQALGEGFECLQRSEYGVDLGRVAALWQQGSVVRSWLLDLLTKALHEEGNALEHISGYVDDSGMGRWSIAYAVENAIPIPVITQSLYERFASRQPEHFSAKVVAALRKQFGGHAVKKE
ncbi:MAG: phosphogluconate dehydrogenase (NAD(+)-dependent, decarboxylating) [Sulfuricaulis sp.]